MDSDLRTEHCTVETFLLEDYYKISAAYKFIKSFTPDGHIVDVSRIDSFDFIKGGPQGVLQFPELYHFNRLKHCLIDNP